jgi:DNA polymerase III delta prime subunit
MIKELLESYIKNTNIDVLRHHLNYHSIHSCDKALRNFLETPALDEWLSSGYYDFKYTSKSLYEKLCELSRIDEKLVEDKLAEIERTKEEQKRFKDAYIFVNTCFKRSSEPIFTLAIMESKRRLSLLEYGEFYFRPIEEILKEVSNIVQQHFKDNKGKVAVWGNIVNYQLYLFGECYIYEPSGEFRHNVKNIDNSFARISLK